MLHFGLLSPIGSCPVCTRYLWLEGESALLQVDPEGRVAPCLLPTHLAGCSGLPFGAVDDANQGTIGPGTHHGGRQPHIRKLTCLSYLGR